MSVTTPHQHPLRLVTYDNKQQWQCSVCFQKCSVNENRYRCASCTNFQSCGTCNRSSPHQHPLNLVISPKSWVCDNCQTFLGENDSRFRCDVCHDYDRCRQCTRMKPHQHTLKKMTYGPDYTWCCNNCGVVSSGLNDNSIRFRCSICSDFDFCKNCVGKARHDDDHPFFQVYGKLWTCDECHVTNIDDRFRCGVCEDYDVCGGCQKNQQVPHHHHQPQQQQQPHHHPLKVVTFKKGDWHCNSCLKNYHAKTPSIDRFRCYECQDFDFCGSCYPSKYHQHPLKKVTCPPIWSCDKCNKIFDYNHPRHRCGTCPDFDLCSSCAIPPPSPSPSPSPSPFSISPSPSTFGSLSHSNTSSSHSNTSSSPSPSSPFNGSTPTSSSSSPASSSSSQNTSEIGWETSNTTPPSRCFKRSPQLPFQEAIRALLLGLPEVPPGRNDLFFANEDDFDALISRCERALSQMEQFGSAEVKQTVELLRRDEALAILAYTCESPYPVYRWLNAWLVQDRRDPLMKSKVGPFFRLLYQGLKKLPKKVVKAGRGVLVAHPVLRNCFNSPPLVGAEISFWGVSSFSVEDSVASGFGGAAGEDAIFYTCGRLHCVSLGGFSLNPREAEVLPLPPAVFKVHSTFRVNEKKLVISLDHEQATHSTVSYV